MTMTKATSNLTHFFLAVILSCILCGPAFAENEEDLNQAFMPLDLGLAIGMPEQELLTALATQGFSFKAGGKYERIKGSKQFGRLLDFVLVVSEEAGASEIWGQGDMLLGVRNGMLVAIGQNFVMGRFEGLKAFQQTDAAPKASIGPADGILPNYRPKRIKEQAIIDEFNGLVWYLEERPSSSAEPDTHVWTHGDVMTILTVRYGIELDRRVDEYHREVSLWHLHFCSFPIMEKIFKSNNYNCSK